MRFKPCIDIHNGKVKQIVGASIHDKDNVATDNFVSDLDADFYAQKYLEKGLYGGHIICLNTADSEFYEANKRQAVSALKSFPKGLCIGGGINDLNAEEYLEYGASHVIVTSFVFQDGDINYQNLEKLVKAVGKEHIILDLSASKIDGSYVIMTDRWQRATRFELNVNNLRQLSEFCDEFLVHAVDVEGLTGGIDYGLATKLCAYLDSDGAKAVAYAGGIASLEDISTLHMLSSGQLDFCVGSALDLFGGSLAFEHLAALSIPPNPR